MRHNFFSFRVKVALLSIPILLFASMSYASKDVLDTPSIMSNLVAKRLLIDIAQAGKRLVAVGSRGHIIYSDDQGKSWKQAKVPVSVLLTAIYFPSPMKGWVVGHDGVILNTTDGGKTWHKQFDGNQANKDVLFQAEQKLKNLQVKYDNASEDEKKNISPDLEDAKYTLDDAKADSRTGASKPFLDVWFKNDKEGFVVGAYGFFFKTTDGGRTWINYSSKLDNPDQYHLNAITQITGGALFIVGEAGTIFRSDDEGSTWQKLQSPYEGSFFGVSKTGNVNELIIFGLRGNLFRSENLGATWTKIPTGVENALNSATLSGDGVLTVVGNSGVVLTSTDAGLTFKVEVRTDRDAVLAASSTKNDNLVLVGEAGVILAGPLGKNL